jgi:two-component system sensor histidine kinase AlgZ
MNSPNLIALAPPLIWIAPLIVAFAALVGMLWHTRIALRRAREAEDAVRQALVDSRLRPHFLLNVLSALRATIDVQPREAILLLDDLAELLHATLRMRLDEPIRMADELQLVRQYLRIEQRRFAENLVATVVADDRALDCDIPPFSLLTLVENAMSHGGVDTLGRRHVSVHVEVSSAAVTASVRNRPSSQARTERHTGLGLATIRDRLQRWDKDAHGPLLTYSSEWVRCAIVLPQARPSRRAPARPTTSADWAMG